MARQALNADATNFSTQVYGEFLSRKGVHEEGFPIGDDSGDDGGDVRLHVQRWNEGSVGHDQSDGPDYPDGSDQSNESDDSNYAGTACRDSNAGGADESGPYFDSGTGFHDRCGCERTGSLDNGSHRDAGQSGTRHSPEQRQRSVYGRIGKLPSGPSGLPD